MDEKKVREAIGTIKSNYPTSGYYMLCEALDIAIEALEKQLPKKLAELKKCPFCGGEAEIIGCESAWIVCKECYAKTGIFNTKEEAIEAWNRRMEE